MSRAIILTCTVITAATIANANIITNGNFESGNTGFTSAYTYDPFGSPAGSEGDYFVGIDSKAWNGNFPASVYDHTTGMGHMLMANGINDQSIVWQQSVNVDIGNVYTFSGWAANLSIPSAALPRLEFLVNGQSVGNILLSSTLTWTEFTGCSWTATQCGPVDLSIRDLEADWYGNDFALDDLSFSQVPEPMTASLIFIIMVAYVVRRNVCSNAKQGTGRLYIHLNRALYAFHRC